MLFLLLLTASPQPVPPPGTILCGSDTVSTVEMITRLESACIVFVGEKHDDPLAHQWELYLWQSLASDQRCLALEMFEADVQDVLDAYLSGEVDLDCLLENGRPWGNYLEDYHPMVEYAAREGYGVVAANVPRPLAAAVAREGWAGLEGEDSADYFLGMGVDSSSSAYRDRFLQTMEMVGDEMHAMPMDPMNIYRAQLLKDAVMAGSVRGLCCLFVCGGFHSDFHSGIPDQLDSGTDYLTVRIVAAGEDWDPEQADYLVIPPGD
jgi:uncharacterized iron-regulated protein